MKQAEEPKTQPPSHLELLYGRSVKEFGIEQVRTTSGTLDGVVLRFDDGTMMTIMGTGISVTVIQEGQIHDLKK